MHKIQGTDRTNVFVVQNDVMINTIHFFPSSSSLTITCSWTSNLVEPNLCSALIEYQSQQQVTRFGDKQIDSDFSLIQCSS